MKISVKNFKSIKQLDNFEIKPFTTLSGVNSSGKSSFIQLLLLIKQTIDIDSSKKTIDLNGDFYKVGDFSDILYHKNYENKLGFTFEFNQVECSQIKSPKIFNYFKNVSDYQAQIQIEYDFIDEREIITKSIFNIISPELDKKEQYIRFLIEKGDALTYSINTNTGIYASELFTTTPPPITNIAYSAIYPTEYEISQKIEREGYESEFVYEVQKPIIDDFKDLVDSFFNSLSYIGPLREQPKDEYSITRNHQYVGSNGEYVAQILEKYANDMIQLHKILRDSDDSIEYELIDTTLLTGVKYWMCNVFNIARDIYAEKVNDNYKIVLVSDSNLETTIKHVGFGISQLLPILVEGLRMPKGGTLILEQPEIHLHPKYQSLLFDFLFGLTKQEKKVIIETHSDHLITRMRRRVAEDKSNDMSKQINLTFIEDKKSGNLFRTLDLDEFGVLNYFPEDFIEPDSSELKAILKAQMKKRK